MKKTAALLLVVGLLQMGGDLLGLPLLRTLSRATAASPAPKVFCAVQGYEAYSTRFFLEWVDDAGVVHVLPLTAERTARLRGAYNRRNVYGAALAYGPILPADLRDAVLHYGLHGEAPLLRELGLEPSSIRDVRVRYEPVTP